MQKIIIGTVSKPQGIKGEIKIAPLTDDLERFYKLSEVYLKNKKYAVNSVKILANGVFLTLEGIDERNKAEELRGIDLEVERINAIKPKEDRYFICDVIGAKIMANGEEIGVLKDILQLGSADVYVISTVDKRIAMIPSIKRIILSTDIDNKIIEIDKQAFEDLVVYED